MAITTGNVCDERPVLRVTSNATFATDDAILYITDLAFNGDNSIATYNTVDQCSTLKFATTTNRTITVTFLRDDTVIGELEDYFDNKTEVNWELSPLGVLTGKPYKTGSAFLSSLNQTKNGTNVWEVSVTLEVSGDISSGTHA